MAEAVGLAASVAGLLSLGLQITGGIATYLDALESRQDELASIKRQNDALSAALDTIKTATSRFQSPLHDRAITTGIEIRMPMIHPQQVFIEALELFYSGCGTEFTILTFKAAIRYATFQALKLAHTCCDTEYLVTGYSSSGKIPYLDKDDVKTINEEQASLLELHEELVAEFQELASEYIKKGPDGTPRFPLFWSEYWTGRITEELKKLDGANLTAEERRGAEDIGVHWCEPPVDESEATNPYDERTLEHWFFELDSVCPELSEPWPEGLRRVDELT